MAERSIIGVAQRAANITLDIIGGAALIMAVCDAVKSGGELRQLATSWDLREAGTALTGGVAYLGAVACDLFLLNRVDAMRRYLNSDQATPPDQG